jgi:hypothetical protein
LDRLRAPELSAVLGLLWTAVSVLDPRRTTGLFLGPLLALGSVVVLGWRARTAADAEPSRTRKRRLGFAVVLAAAYAVAGLARPEFRADTGSYFVYLRSAVFDHDLDFTNDWTLLGYPVPGPTETGFRNNWQSVGPALLWSPFYLCAHAYVRADTLVDEKPHLPNGVSAPYRRSMALGTVTAVVAGAWLLAGMMARAIGGSAAALAVVGAIVTSPILYYVFVVPGMAHGVTFALAAALLWAWDRARRAPSLGAWSLLGALLGLLAATRFQAAVYGLLPMALAVIGLRRRSVRPAWLAAAVAVAFLALLPQLLAWKTLFGRFVTIPQGPEYLDWSAPHVLDVLLSANHGFFTWTPAMLLGVAGLVLGLVRAPLLCGLGLLIGAAVAWTNGSVTDWDWAAGDAFGARRFDLVVPLVAVGFGWLVHDGRRWLGRASLLVPSALLLAFGLWNVGLIALVREGRYPHAVPLERLAADQARLFRRAVQGVAGFVAGETGRALAYKALAGEYVYRDFARDGTMALADVDERFLPRGWSPPAHRRAGESNPGAAQTYRWALFPEACVSVPLERERPVAVAVLARAPRRLGPQVMTASLDDQHVGEATLSPAWSLAQWPVGPELWASGENRLCLRFAGALPGAAGQPRAAAAVAAIVLLRRLEDLPAEGSAEAGEPVGQDEREP